MSSSEEEFNNSDSDTELIERLTNLKPYQFEPTKTVDPTKIVSSDSDSEDNSDTRSCNNKRVDNTNWCKCGQCRKESRECDCLCCNEVSAIDEVKFSGE